MEEQNDLFAEIEDVAGLEAAQVLASAYGGTVIYIPGKVTSDHPFQALIGEDAFTKLVNHFRVGSSGIRILVPMGQNWKRSNNGRQVLRLSTEGVSAQEIARQLNIHVRTVYRYLAAKKMGLR